MFCCTQETASLFSKLARLYRWRYLRLGLEKSQKQLVSGLEQVGYRGASLLEVGCGVGYLHQHLLHRGAARAVGIDLSPKMIAEAQELAHERGIADRVEYFVGDFLEQAEQLPAADIAILDKVICCYPDAERLLRAAAGHARRAVALTYPRRHLVNRAAARLINGLLALGGNDFRTKLHPPELVADVLKEAGLRLVFSATTPIWRTEIYMR